jgi:hypothetical protein
VQRILEQLERLLSSAGCKKVPYRVNTESDAYNAAQKFSNKKLVAWEGIYGYMQMHIARGIHKVMMDPPALPYDTLLSVAKGLYSRVCSHM